MLAKLTTHFAKVHSRQCVDEAELAEHVVGLTCSLASCQFRLVFSYMTLVTFAGMRTVIGKFLAYSVLYLVCFQWIYVSACHKMIGLSSCFVVIDFLSNDYLFPEQAFIS